MNKKLIRVSCKAGPDGWGKTSMMTTSKVRKRSLSVRSEKEGPNCHTHDFVLVFHAYLTSSFVCLYFLMAEYFSLYRFLLTIPPSVGYEQNPLSVYYCYDFEGSVAVLKKCIAEVEYLIFFLN